MSTDEYGSVHNMLFANSKSPEPVVGMGGTICSWTDRHACTVVRVSDSGKTVWVKRDIAVRVDKNGMSECQNYEYSPDDSAPEEKFRRRQNGTWGNLRLGFRNTYHDFSF